MYTIRKATIEDTETIRQIADETWWVAYSPILEKEQISYMLNELYSEEKIAAQLTDNTQTYLLLLEAIRRSHLRRTRLVMKTPKFISSINYTACPKHKAKVMAKF